MFVQIMDIAKNFLKKHNIVPTISFKDGKAHTLKILNAKEDSLTDDTGKVIEGMAFLVEEDGEHKRFFTGSISLISKLANVELNDVVEIQMKKKKTDKGYKSYFSVKKGQSEVEEVSEDLSDDDIPIIEEDVGGEDLSE